MKLVLATNNRDKAREIIAMLAGLDVQVSTLADHPDFPATVEDGDTLHANALKKAREARDYTSLSALADDTGLEVDALNGAPGVFSARFAGEKATYADNCAKLLREMDGVPVEQRGARFRTVMALALAPQDAKQFHGQVAGGRTGPVREQPPSGAPFAPSHSVARPRGAAPLAATRAWTALSHLLTDGALPGAIATERRGDQGFGYDPLFIDTASGRTLAEMTLEEKNRTSHRYRALIEMRELMLRLHLARETQP